MSPRRGRNEHENVLVRADNVRPIELPERPESTLSPTQGSKCVRRAQFEAFSLNLNRLNHTLQRRQMKQARRIAAVERSQSRIAGNQMVIFGLLGGSAVTALVVVLTCWCMTAQLACCSRAKRPGEAPEGTRGQFYHPSRSTTAATATAGEREDPWTEVC